MIYFDWYFFDDYKFDNIINYLAKKVALDELNKFIIDAIISGELKHQVLKNRIEYCAQNGIKEILDFVVGLLGNSTEIQNSLFQTILNYLADVNQLKDCLFFYNQYSSELKHLALTTFINKNNKAILPYIENDIKAGGNIEHLISLANASMKLNSKIGIEYFINWCEKNKIIYGDDFYEMDFSALNSIDDLKDLIKLLDLSYKYKKKRRLDSFMSRINDALLGIAIQSLSNLKAVTQTLKQFIANSKHKDVNYQHWYIDRMIKQFLDNNQCINES